ncbi:MAG: DinB family protein [Saprospiraceae bacterium]|nr:DinB family protein [Saprospiraceae bacterium]
MKVSEIIQELQANGAIFRNLLEGVPLPLHRWKSHPETWCLLEIVCHLHDVEGEDFRDRLRHTLETPDEVMPSIFPNEWVQERKYLEQDLLTQLNAFLKERDQSIQWLLSLRTPKWDNVYQHPDFGPLSAQLFLHNWLVHDYLHIRQILKVKYAYLDQSAPVDLSYAGNW